MTTPMLSLHARERCEEMGIRTKAVKHLIASTTKGYARYPGHSGRTVVSGPDFAAIVSFAQSPPTVVTVLFRGEYTRPSSVTS